MIAAIKEALCDSSKLKKNPYCSCEPYYAPDHCDKVYKLIQENAELIDRIEGYKKVYYAKEDILEQIMASGRKARNERDDAHALLKEAGEFVQDVANLGSAAGCHTRAAEARGMQFKINEALK